MKINLVFPFRPLVLWTIRRTEVDNTSLRQELKAKYVLELYLLKQKHLYTFHIIHKLCSYISQEKFKLNKWLSFQLYSVWEKLKEKLLPVSAKCFLGFRCHSWFIVFHLAAQCSVARWWLCVWLRKKVLNTYNYQKAAEAFSWQVARP